MNFSSDRETIQSLHRLQKAVGELYQTCQQRLIQAEEVLKRANSIKVSVAEIQSVHTVLEQIGGQEKLNSLIVELNKTHSILVDFPDLEQRLQEKLTEYKQQNLINNEISQEILDRRLEVQEIANKNQQLSDDIQRFYHQNQAIYNNIQELTTKVEESSQATQQIASQATEIASQLQNDRIIIQEQINSGEQILNNTRKLSDRVETIYSQVQTEAEQVGIGNIEIQQRVNQIEDIATNLKNDRRETQTNCDLAQSAMIDTYLARDEVINLYNQLDQILYQFQIKNQNNQQELEANYKKITEQASLGQQALNSHQLIRDEVAALYNKIQQNHHSFPEKVSLVEEVMRPLRKFQITLEQQIELVNEHLYQIKVNRNEIVNIFHHINEITKRVEQRHQENERKISRLEKIEINVINTHAHIQSMLTEMRSIAMEIKLKTS